MRLPPRPAALAVVALLVGCGGDPGAGPELGDALDGIDPGDVVVDAADVIDDTSSGDSLTAPDAADAPDSDDGDDGDDGRDTMPGPCPSGEACNDLLVEGACRATCVPIDDVLRCPGVVVDGVCHGSDPRVADPTETTIDDLVVTTVAAPSGPTAVGEVIHLELSVANASDHDVSLPFGASWSEAWDLTDASFLDWVAIDVPAHGATALTATMTALRPDELDDDADSVDDSPRRIITFYLGEGRVTLHGGIPFGDDGALACGARHFPADLEARCCAGVLYPGAACCASTDCAAGQCADGLCVAAVPDLASAAPIHGTHRILVALADFPELATGPGGDASADPCADRPDLVATLGLDTVTGFFRGSAEARMGLDAIDFRWTILAGLDSDAIVPAGADRWLPFYRDHLAEWLAAHPGCPVLDDFDEVVIASPEVDLHGFGGVFVGRGTVGTTTYASPWLFAHELGHAFGAIDLKPLFGGAFLWTRALMAVHGGADATDQVAWAEWGMGDTDGDGVVDLAELAAYPETFAVSDLRARIEPSDDPVAPVDQLVIAWTPVALEAGREKRLAHADFDVALPEHAYAAHISQGGVTKRLVLPQAALHWSDLLARGAITVTLQADHPFTRADGTRAAVHLDETVEVPVR